MAAHSPAQRLLCLGLRAGCELLLLDSSGQDDAACRRQTRRRSNEESASLRGSAVCLGANRQSCWHLLRAGGSSTKEDLRFLFYHLGRRVRDVGEDGEDGEPHALVQGIGPPRPAALSAVLKVLISSQVHFTSIFCLHLHIDASVQQRQRSV